MQKNVGTTDAMIRITGGLLGLAYGVGRMSRRPYRTPWVLMGLSAMKVAEGVTRFCPMYASIGMNSTGEKIEGSSMMNKIKNAGIQAVMDQVTGSSDRSAKKGEEQSESHRHTTTSRDRHEMSLSAEDRKIEETVREFVKVPEETKSAVAGTDQKHRSESYSHDEHRYPTYS